LLDEVRKDALGGIFSNTSKINKFCEDNIDVNDIEMTGFNVWSGFNKPV
jgi:hypothetical protein